MIYFAMGEKAHLPNGNGFSNENNEQAPPENEGAEETNEDDDMSPEEFQMLDSQLDALNSALDDIEQKNDNIHAQLLQLLQSNKEIRQQMQQNTADDKMELEPNEKSN